MRKPIFLFIAPLLAFFLTLPFNSQAMESHPLTFFVSPEVQPCLTSGGNPKACDVNKSDEQLVLNTAQNLRNDWVKYNRDRCSTIPTIGEYIDNNIIRFNSPKGVLYATVELRDISLGNIDNSSIPGTLATTQGGLNSVIGSTMQDSSPKPINWLDYPYWTENSGSSNAGSRNALVFRFFDSQMKKTTVNSFGAWFGDLETRSDVLPAVARLYDTYDNHVSEITNIIENEDTDLSLCGSVSGTGLGCGNRTTRWIGFSNLSNDNVHSMMVAVGEDDIDGDGSREHLSFTGATIALASECSTSTPTIAPLEPTPTIEPTPEIEVSPTTTIVPTPETTLIPTQTPEPTIEVTPTATPTEAIPTPTNVLPTPTIIEITPTPETGSEINRFCSEILPNGFLNNERKLVSRLLEKLLSKICN